MTISIHAPRTGSDAEPPAAARAASNFNPRSPHGERRKRFLLSLCNHIISIHAPRTGSDETINNYFNPRSPHGERPP